MQEELEGWNVSKITIFFSSETHIDTDLPLDGDTRGYFGSYNDEVVVHAGMDDYLLVVTSEVTSGIPI